MFPKKILCVLPRNAARRRSSTCKTRWLHHQHGKVCAVWSCAAPCCLSVLYVCVCALAAYLLYPPPCVSVCMRVCFHISAYAHLLGPTSMRLECDGFSRWSEDARKKTANERLMSFTQPQLGYLWLHQRKDVWMDKWTQFSVFTDKSYGSSSWGQMRWPVLVRAQTCLFFPVCSNVPPFLPS